MACVHASFNMLIYQTPITTIDAILCCFRDLGAIWHEFPSGLIKFIVSYPLFTYLILTVIVNNDDNKYAYSIAHLKQKCVSQPTVGSLMFVVTLF